jgi:septal ring factor EnvC (AmiA/AmiB activator)
MENPMSDMPQNDGGNSMVRTILMVAVVVYMIGSAVFMVMAQIHLGDLEKQQSESQKAMAKTNEDNAQLRAQVSVLAGNIGMTQKELNKKAATLQSEEKATQSRLKADEESTKQQFGQVAGEVNGVKSDVSKMGADLGDTKTDLATTKGKLEHAIGDLNRHSELIATNHDELEVLKHRGDRDYVEFTLKKGSDPMHLSTVSLQLKKVDPKKSQFTLYVMADDKRIEKKDKTINEPLQFYTGRDRNLFEVVINAVDKNAVSGYMSTPKNMAAVVRPDPRAPAPQQQ